MTVAAARCHASTEFGVWWCNPPAGVVGPPWQTIVFLHGFGEAGDGSVESLEKIGQGAGLPREIADPHNELLRNAQAFPFLVVAPQSPTAWRDATDHDRVVRLTRRLVESGLIRGRPILAGFSYGGDGGLAHCFAGRCRCRCRCFDCM